MAKLCGVKVFVLKESHSFISQVMYLQNLNYLILYALTGSWLCYHRATHISHTLLDTSYYGRTHTPFSNVISNIHNIGSGRKSTTFLRVQQPRGSETTLVEKI